MKNVSEKDLLKRLEDMLHHTYQLSENKDWDVLYDIQEYLKKKVCS